MKKKSVLCFFLLLVIFHSCEKSNVNSSNSEVTIDSRENLSHLFEIW